ncbi:beta-N-acetylhexosaminidase [Streptomyces albireticuli]|uniref:Beta-N-acetylglucosaminidase n=1 Tax=Streptomyces albireticuli TaxID=1940 RepID=A0A2A2D4V3_9ACTN|nr:glycoside hydrolase family 20 protein [Streptomyces albireticuli]MCD9142808.1 family 20 glycosylhydrolase [Streptomyces albireticuli]MCD9162873.1 family 20 glycosylhydrolase [Streptomyces albireticuli]MCD9192433.1 family 20 glycosylhydrolase [Streptomyces albireticuli]PAU46360.1 beta-N-acetylglucosaminidase [Streptomyces albireticuli]
MGLPAGLARTTRFNRFNRLHRIARLARIARAAAPRGAVAAAALLATVTLVGCPRESATRPAQDDSRSPGASQPVTPSSAPPSATSRAPVPAGVPRTVPGPRSATSVPGPGWRPAAGARVVTDPEGPLADEARLLAVELKMTAAGTPARPGDIELALRPGQSGGDEAYELTADDHKVLVTSAGEAGVFYGTRTLAQAVRSGGGLPEGVVRDAPDRGQRGLNLDIARKHFTAEWIEARIRELADLKLNQLGLHFSDDQGFRIESESHPEIVSPQHLTKAEVRRIVALADSLHITVVPEIDSPGHLGAVIKAHPGLQLKDASGTAARGAVDIANPEAARIVDDLLREYAPLFPGAYFHLGADEYRALMAKDPEASYPRLAQLARQRYGDRGRVQDLATAWLNDRAGVVRGLGKKPKAWNDGFFTGGVVSADKDIEVEYWTGKELGARDPQEYLNEGRRVVNLNDEYLYYVLGEPNQFRYPTGERIYRQWSPAVLRGTTAAPQDLTGPDRVTGGRLAVWCDFPDAQTPQQVADGIRLPLAAVAQRLWDPRPPTMPWKEFSALAGRVAP